MSHLERNKGCPASGVDELGHWKCTRPSKYVYSSPECDYHTASLADQIRYRGSWPDPRRPPELYPISCVVESCHKKPQRRTTLYCRLHNPDNIVRCRIKACSNRATTAVQGSPLCDHHTRSRITYDQVASMRNEPCFLCGREDTNRHIDHDHSCCGSGKYCAFCVRGPLCVGCNTRLVAGYEALPDALKQWPLLNKYLSRRPLLNHK